jgi:hypothetical protein
MEEYCFHNEGISHMASVRYNLFFSVVLCSLGGILFARNETLKDIETSFSGTLKNECFFGHNTTFLNNRNPFDKVFYNKTTLDGVMNQQYGMATYGDVVAEFTLGARTKVFWGNPNSISRTTDATIKLLDGVIGDHSHNVPRLFFWIREMWLDLDLNVAFNLPFEFEHHVVIGAFPFSLGRGIALGDAYAVGPDVLGFYTESIVDQYAFGLNVTGKLCEQIMYDLYTAVLQNKCTTLRDTGAKILGQKYDRLASPERGFGKINYLSALRLIWSPLDDECYGKLRVEPYVLYNHDPEQTVFFPADASSKLATFGLAAEYVGDTFEWSFDSAFNVGYQEVFGWDQNVVRLQNQNGAVIVVNSQVNAVIDGAGTTVPVPFIASGDAQSIINTSVRSQSQNNHEIGRVATVGNLTPSGIDMIILKNSGLRFRDPYKNTYDGWMFATDFSHYLCEKALKVSVALAVASGDDNPNIETKDGHYSGFIPLQSIYSGKTVRSATFLGSAGDIARPLSTPDPSQILGAPFAENLEGFTNLIVLGASLNYEPREWSNRFKINPNVLGYWEQFRIGTARTYLGTEINTFINYNILQNVELFFVGSIFVPGGFYSDRAELPLNRTQLTPAQDAYIDRPDVTGFEDRVPGLGDDVAVTFNLGIKYLF